MTTDFLNQYIETALWSSTTDTDEPMDRNHDKTHLAPDTLRQMTEDCRDFYDRFWELIADDPTQAAHDFWLTRNHHGAGFWDGDWPESIGQYLTRMSHEYGSVDLYVGDDGLIYC